MSLANPSRRGFLKAGGLLLVTVNLPAPLLALAEQGATDLPLDQALALERKAFQLLFDSHDQKEGMRAFLEKRTAEYLGK